MKLYAICSILHISFLNIFVKKEKYIEQQLCGAITKFFYWYHIQTSKVLYNNAKNNRQFLQDMDNASSGSHVPGYFCYLPL